LSKLQPKLITTLKGYTKKQLGEDIIAGIIVAIIALPLSIALAIASGVSPEKGLHTAIIAGFIISMLGGSRVQIGGPTGAFMVIVYGIVTEFGLEGLIIATFLAGIIMMIMGLLKLGSIIKFIPYPITTGFTSGIAVVIFSSQIKDFLGLNIKEVPVEFIEKWRSYFEAYKTINIETFVIGVIALAIIIFWPKINRRVPGPLIAIIVTVIIVKIFDLEVATIGSKFQQLSSSLPEFQIPQLSIDRISPLIMPAFTIALLGSIESLLSAVVSDGMIGGKHRSNMELIAQGIANIASALFGGIPATGAIARTVANIKNGGRTPIAGMVHSVTLLFIMLLFMPLAKMIPLTSLAAILIMVAYNMSEWKNFKEMFKAPKSDIIILLTTFLITVLVDLVIAIEIGMVLAAFLFMKRMAEISTVNVDELDASEEKNKELEKIYSERYIIDKDIQIYEINGPFFFGAADKFLEALNKLEHRKKKLILIMKNVPVMDATALQAFKTMIDICEKSKIKVLIVGINQQPLKVLNKAGIYSLVGKENFYNTLEDILKSK